MFIIRNCLILQFQFTPLRFVVQRETKFSPVAKVVMYVLKTEKRVVLYVLFWCLSLPALINLWEHKRGMGQMQITTG